MSDHLNSMHLDAPRREKFRMARAAMLNNCGDQTRMAGLDPNDSDERRSLTMIQDAEGRLPEGIDYGLVENGVVYPLKVGLNTVGRMPDNEVVIEDPYVSRRHCAIVIHAKNGVELHDVASKNGTYLNGSRLSSPTTINPGDEIRMCDRQLIFITKPNGKNFSAYARTLNK
jgi:pSer/pThr/pTyr-binding forkhead associated (FHA) protein